MYVIDAQAFTTKLDCPYDGLQFNGALWIQNTNGQAELVELNRGLRKEKHLTT